MTPRTPDAADLAPYEGLREKTLRGAAPGGYFVCEGRRLVADAVRAAEDGRLRLVSILCEEGRAGEWEAGLPSGARLLVLGPHEINSLLGYAFHRGVLCCCAVPDPPGEDALLSAKRLLVLPRIDNQDNLGQLARTAAALGMDAILLGGGPDPFSRRCVRVSMGAVWKMPIYRRDGAINAAGADKTLGALGALDAWLRCGGGASEIVGTADAPGAVPLNEWQPAPRTALVLGPEDSGLDAAWREKCDRHVRIPMARQMDSLNVAAAGAVLMAWMAGGGASRPT